VTSVPYAPYLASWGSRAGAYLIDSVILVLLWLCLYVAAIAFGTGAFGWLTIVASVLVVPAYYTFQHGRSGQTVGNAQASIKVVDQRTGETIGYARAFVRWLVMAGLFVLFYVPGIINVLWPIWDTGNQALHDKVVRSHVVRMT
jgi:uncharacterized RDD family membrane protein YckC